MSADPTNDTSPEAEAFLIEGYRRMSPVEKLARVFEINASLERLAAARIRAQYGEVPSAR